MNYNEVLRLADDHNKTLLATDPRFNRAVHLVHRDGSFFFWSAAFIMSAENWLVVFTEHHYGFHVLDREDVISFRIFEQLSDDLEELKGK